MDSSPFLIDHPSLACRVAEGRPAQAEDAPDTLPMPIATSPEPLAVTLRDVAAIAPGNGFSEFMDSISAPEVRRRNALTMLIRSHRSALTDLSRLQRELLSARAELAARSADLSEAMDLAGLLGWSLTLADRRLRLSPALSELFGWPEAGDAPRGMSALIDQVEAGDREGFRAMLMQVLRRGVAERGEVVLVDRDGHPVPMRVRLKPRTDSAGRTVGLRALMIRRPPAGDAATIGAARLPDDAAASAVDRAVAVATAEALQVQDVVQAFRHGGFHPVFQSVVDGLSGAPIGAEALIRCTHAERGLVLPAEFLPLCEEAGLDGQLSRLMLRQACLHVADWQQVAGSRVFVSVNLSARQLARSELVWDIMDALSESGLASDALMLEVNEATLARDPLALVELMQYLKQTGVRIAVDNFGADPDSLRRLAGLPVDCLKIDRRLTARVGDPSGAAAIRGIVALAGGRGIELVAEGVETTDQRDRLLALGCRSMQGYLFSRPTQSGLAEGPDRSTK